MWETWGCSKGTHERTSGSLTSKILRCSSCGRRPVPISLTAALQLNHAQSSPCGSLCLPSYLTFQGPFRKKSNSGSFIYLSSPMPLSAFHGPPKETLNLENPNPQRVQVPNNHIRTQNLYYNYYCPKPKYLIVGYLDP